jgi:cyanophycin synthetase
VRGFLHDAGSRQDDSAYEAWIEFHVPELSLATLKLGFDIALNAHKPNSDQAFVSDPRIDELLKLCRTLHPDFQARILMLAARAAGIPVMPFFSKSKYWQYGWGKRGRVFMETSSNLDGYLGGGWQKDKQTTKQLLNSIGVETPRHVLVTTEEQLRQAAKAVGFPCVVKPFAGGGGRGVTANISNESDLRSAFRFARDHSRDPVMVEEMVQGLDHRLHVIGGKLAAVICREPSFVVGDGKRTIRELIEEVNSTRSLNLVKSRYLYPVAIDDVLNEHLKSQGIKIDEQLAKAKKVTLRSNANRSTGGICSNKTKEAHPQVIAMAEQIAAASGLYAIGIDYLTTDIRQPPSVSGGRVIEINAIPGLSALAAAGIEEQELGSKMLGDELRAIPVRLTIVDDQEMAFLKGQTEEASLERGAGIVCGPVLKIGNLALHGSSVKPWESVRAALRNRTLENLEVIASDQEIVRDGLPVNQLQGFTIRSGHLSDEWRRVLDRAVNRFRSPPHPQKSDE